MENAWDIPENQGCVYPDAMEGCPLSQAKQVPHRRYLPDYLERIHRAGLPGNVNPDLCLPVPDTVSATVQPVIAAAGEEALRASLGVERDAHLPWGRPPESIRRGSSQRAGLTPYGPLADVPGPKRRRGNGALPWHSRPRSERCWGPLLDHQGLR